MKETVSKLKAALTPIYGKGESDAIIRLIFHYLKGWNLTDILTHSEDELSPFLKQEIDSILERLLNFEPIQYITGTARFHGFDLKVEPGVLIPRPETEQLVDLIIDENSNRQDLRILDICTGSGCIAIALAKDLPFSEVTALDISEKAIAIAKENSAARKVKVNYIRKDIFEWKPSQEFDIIVSNPPYVLDSEASGIERNVMDYEPHEALFVRDDDPLRFYIRIAKIGKECLAQNGKIYFETNPLTVRELKNKMERLGYAEVQILRDSFGKERFLTALNRGSDY